MSRRHTSNDSTTDFFLKVIQKEKEKIMKEDRKIDSINYNKTINKVSKFYNYINQTIDKIIYNKACVMFLSFIMAFALFIGISGGDVLTSPTSGTTLENIPVNIIGLDDSLELQGMSEEVTVGLIGPSLDIYATQLSKNYSVYVDLTGLEKGTHNVTFQATGFSDTLTVMVVPQNIDIKLSKKIRASFDVEYEFVNEDKLDQKYSVSVKDAQYQQVTLYASQETIDRVHKVVALIDVEGKTADFTQDAKLIAYDSNGKELEIEIAPTTMKVECSVASYSKEVPVQAKFVGQLASGYAVSNYSLSSSTVTIYGLQEDLDQINLISVNVDVEGIKQSTTFNDIEITKETGINKMSTEKITVQVEVERVITKVFDKIPIKVLNNSSNNIVSFVGESGQASVTIKGIESKIKTLTQNNIQATVDVNGLSRGTKKVDVVVAVDDETLEIALNSSSKVSVNIERK